MKIGLNELWEMLKRARKNRRDLEHARQAACLKKYALNHGPAKGEPQCRDS